MIEMFPLSSVFPSANILPNSFLTTILVLGNTIPVVFSLIVNLETVFGAILNVYLKMS